ncbi:MAG TPA: type II toxin-antitoxin system PemK/MazF family toxin [Acidimicrobiia bacterium]|nr:type II toxin-antitoxin system PemK/MazF family toxin [Acidimicrobiia bacterium]
MRRPGWGEIWWCDLEPGGKRPVVVLSRPESVGRLRRILVAPATTKVRNLPTEVHLDNDDGVPRPCVLNLDTPELVDPRTLTDYMGQLSPLRWGEVCAAMSTAINC